MDKLNILVLHSLGSPNSAPNFLLHHVFSLRKNFPEHQYVYHDTGLPIPDYVRDAEFDAIILDVTFLCARWSPPEFFMRLKEDYAFVKHSNAVKIAFPQDEYDCNELLDDWMCDWRVDVVFSVISSNWELLYPRYHQAGAIKLGYTGYVDESLLRIEPQAFEHRRIDIGYRARKLPPYFGRTGETKWLIGESVSRLARENGMNADIVLGDQGTLLGRAWLDFINDCKFTLGANSGSSLLDPRGDIQRKVRAYLRRHPNAAFDEVESQCFPGLDGKHQFTAISPRVLEAALLNSCQILVEGDYSEIIRPWEHYIPIRSDASNFGEVLEAMRDRSLVQRLIQNCRSAILDVQELRYRDKAQKVLALIESLAERKGTRSSSKKIGRIAQRYEEEMQERYRRMWRKRELRHKLARIVDDYPSISRLARATYALARKFAHTR